LERLKETEKIRNMLAAGWIHAGQPFSPETHNARRLGTPGAFVSLRGGVSQSPACYRSLALLLTISLLDGFFDPAWVETRAGFPIGRTHFLAKVPKVRKLTLKQFKQTPETIRT
jgi:hypothetical protein